MSEDQPLTAIEKKVDQMIEGKSEAKEEDRIVDSPAPTMIQEARQLKQELQGIRDEIKNERERLDDVNAHAILGGNSILGEPIEKTKEQIAEEEAKNILAIYGK